MRAVSKAGSDRTRVRSSGPPVRAAGVEGRHAILGAARWRVWAPILMRMLAFGLALLGLAGIGLAASRSPALTALADAPGGALELARLASPHLEVSAAGTSVGPASVAPPTSQPAPPPVAEAKPGSAAPDPCSKGPAPPEPPGAAPAARASAQEGRGVRSDGRIVLNLANSVDLRRLPGVGAKRAELIVSLRQRLGRFKRPSDLLRIKGIGPRTLERMLPHLVLDAE